MVRLLIGAVLLFLALWGLTLVFSVLTPFAVAFGIAYFLNPAANALERTLARALSRSPALLRRLPPRTLAVALLAAAVAAVLMAALFIIVPATYHQVTEAVGRAPEYARVLRAKLEPLYQRLQLRYPDEMEVLRVRLQEALASHLPVLVSPLTHVVGVAFSSALGFVLALLNLFVVPVFAAYLLLDMNRIREGAKNLVPHRFRSYVYSRANRIDHLLSAFARGQVTVALILGAFYGIALTACGVPLGLVVGFFIGLLNLVPFMSHVIGLPLALLLSWVDDQSPARLGAVAGVFAFGQFVEGNFITPRIVGESLGLHAVVIMLAVLGGGTLFGFVGMLLAVPTTAALSVFYEDLRDAYLGSEFYQGGATPPSP
jgi:predicted PurR-regulated permease PerM